MELDLSCPDNYLLKKHLFTLKTHRSDGLMLQIHHSDSKEENKKYKFIYASFNFSGTQLAVSDYKGHVFIISLELESYWQLPKVGFPTVISFPVLKKQELLIGLHDTSILFLDTETGNTIGVLHGHSVAATEVSYSDDGYYYLTSCSAEAIVWDSSTYNQIHRLSLKEEVFLKKVFFMPVTNHILACFQDDTIHIWKFGTFECIKRIVPETWKTYFLKSIAIAKNGKVMILGGQSSNLVIFCLDTWSIKSVVEFPENISGVQQLEFLPQVFDGGASKILVVLTTSQELFFFDIESLGFLKWMSQINGIAAKFSLSCNGKYLAAVVTTGDVNIYSVQRVLSSNTTPGIQEESFNQVPGIRNHSSSSKRTQKSCETLNSIQREIKEILDVKKLLPILKQFGEYPQSYRTLIWKTILQIPENQECFISLSMKACHPCYSKVELKYPLANKSLCNSLKKLLSNITHWCPLFGEVDFLPEFVFPFVKLFHSNPMICFEVVATVIVNWCQNWFEFYPFPPINLLSLLESILAYHDPDLLEFYMKNNITSSISVCPLYHTAFSEVLSKSEWLKLWDHVLSNETSFLFMAIIAYNVVCQNAIKNLKDSIEIQKFFRSQNPVDMSLLIGKAYQYLKETPEDIHTRQFFTSFRSIGSGGTYNKFLAYPKLIFDTGTEKLQAIRKEEEKILEEQFKALNIKKALEKKLNPDKTNEDKEKIYQELEERIRVTVEKEEDRLLAERQKLKNLRQELKLKELEVLESTREEVLKKKIKQKQVEFERLLKDISKQKFREKIEVGTIEKEIRDYYSDLLLRKCQLELELGLNNSDSAPDGNLQAHREKLANDLTELQYEWDNYYHGKHIDICNKITTIKGLLCDVETEIAKEVVQKNSENYLKNDQVLVETLKEKVNALEDEVEKLIKKNLESLQSKKEEKKYASLRLPVKSELLRKQEKNSNARSELKHTVKTRKTVKSAAKKIPQAGRSNVKKNTANIPRLTKSKLKDSGNEKESGKMHEEDWDHFMNLATSKLSTTRSHGPQLKSKFTHFTEQFSDENLEEQSDELKTCHMQPKGDCPSEKKMTVQKGSMKKSSNSSSLKIAKGDPLSGSVDEIFKSTLRARRQIIEEAKRRQRFQ